MNKKGFTLVELLAAIIILSLLALLAGTSVTNVVKNSKNELYDSQLALIKSAAELWGADNLSLLPNAGECKYLTLGDLKKYGTLDSNIINPKTNEEFSDDMIIKISSKETEYGSLDINYEIEPSDITGCSAVPKSFVDDSWATIVAAVKAGDFSVYNVGDTKEIALTGYTNGEPNSNGLYTVRIANTSTPDECSTEGFSQTACGFVIEFVDIITTNSMNSTNTNVGGYPASSMYTYIQNDIYNALPEELKSVIIPTTVVSSHGSTSGETNFVSEDKVYLLSTKEVWGKEGTSNIITNDTAEVETRQLDYYSNLGVTTSNCSGAIKKYNGSDHYWWLRSATSLNASNFCNVYIYGNWLTYNAHNTRGVAVAFRIG